MASNLDRFKPDLQRLIEEGLKLELAMRREIDHDDLRSQLTDRFGAKDAETLIKGLPNFSTAYESWYSEALALLRQLLPDRLADFVGFYEKPKGRKSVDYGNYVIQDYLQRLRVTYAGEVKVDRSAAIPQFQQQLAILKAAEKRFTSSLFDIRQLVQADLLDGEIAAARELTKGKFVRAAGAVAGVVLEKHLVQVCADHAIKIAKKNPTIGDLNELLKTNNAIETHQWRHISMLADLRNLCDHQKKTEPTVEQVTDLNNGADKILKTVS